MTASVGLSQLVISLNDTVGHGFSLLSSVLFVCIALYTAARLFAAEAAQTEVPEKSEESNENE